jgi:thiamine pyrophosphokinase
LLNDPNPKRAVIVADGDVPPLEEVAAYLDAATAGALVIAADGGLHRVEALGLTPNLVVGDGDSIAPAMLAGLAERDIELRLHPGDKDASDTELAVEEAIARGATELVILGALGGVRFDHALANVLLLSKPALAGLDVRLVDGRTIVRLLAGDATLSLRAADGRLVSLLPLSERVEGVRTRGLRFPLRDEPLDQGPARGLSNEMTGEDAAVSIARGRLAVIQTRIGGRP